jgi:hypothetical protein
VAEKTKTLLAPALTWSGGAIESGEPWRNDKRTRYGCGSAKLIDSSEVLASYGYSLVVFRQHMSDSDKYFYPDCPHCFRNAKRFYDAQAVMAEPDHPFDAEDPQCPNCGKEPRITPAHYAITRKHFNQKKPIFLLGVGYDQKQPIDFTQLRVNWAMFSPKFDTMYCQEGYPDWVPVWTLRQYAGDMASINEHLQNEELRETWRNRSTSAHLGYSCGCFVFLFLIIAGLVTLFGSCRH